MSVLIPKKAGELVSKLAKNVLILPDGLKKLAYEVSSARLTVARGSLTYGYTI
jgi:hypothetical protein